MKLTVLLKAKTRSKGKTSRDICLTTSGSEMMDKSVSVKYSKLTSYYRIREKKDWE